MWNYKRTEKYWHIVKTAEFENFIKNYNPYHCFTFGKVEIDENMRKKLWRQADTPKSYEDLLVVAECKGYKPYWAIYKAKELGYEVSTLPKKYNGKPHYDDTDEYYQINGDEYFYFKD